MSQATKVCPYTKLPYCVSERFTKHCCHFATADALITKNDCYNLLTNNCKTFANQLTKKITVETPAGQTALEDPVDIGEVEFDGDGSEQYEGDDGNEEGDDDNEEGDDGNEEDD